MICPRCHYASPNQQMRCPACQAAFDAARLEKLGQLEYLRSRISAWEETGDVDAEAAAQVLNLVADELSGLRRELGLELAEVGPVDEAPASPAPPSLAESEGARRVAVSTPAAPSQDVAHTAPISAPAPPPPGDAATRSRASGWLAWLRHGRQLIAVEVALHGLLYFGVLLTFAGTLGFALFAFGSVDVRLRPVAEALAPTLLFGAAWLLRRQALRLVAGSLELLAGAVTIVALFTSLADRASLPPDLEGSARAAGWAACALVLLGIYGLVVRRRPSSALRYLLAPLVWIACWSLGLLGGHFSVWQYPPAAVAVVATLAAADRARGGSIARATQRAALAGLPLAYGLALLFAARAGWPALPVALTALAVLAGTGLLGDGVGTSRAVPYAQTLIAALTLPALAPAWGEAPAALLAVLAGIGLSEWHGRRRADEAAVYLDLVLIAAGLALAVSPSDFAIAAWGVAAVWLNARTFWLQRRLPIDAWLQIVLTAALPLGFGSVLWLSLSHAVAWLVMASVLCALAMLVRRWPEAERTRFTAWYAPVVAAAIGLGTATTAPAAGSAALIGLALAASLLAATYALAPCRPLVRLWGAIIATAWAVALALDAAQAGADARALVWAAIGLACILAACGWRPRLNAHLMLAGYIAAGFGLATAGGGWDRFAALTIWLLAGLAAVQAQERGGTSLGWIVPSPRWLARTLAYAPLVLLLSSVPFWVLDFGDQLGLFAQRGRVGLALGLTGFAYALVARRLAARRPLAPIVAVASVVVTAAGIAVAAPVLVPSTLAVAIAIAGIAVLSGSLRRPFMTWLAWALSALLALLLLRIAGVAKQDLPQVLFGWACVCLIGSLAYDDVRAGRRAAGEALRQAWLLRPFVLGALALPASLAFLLARGPDTSGWWLLGAAAVYLIVAWQLRAGAISLAGYLLASFAATLLLPWNAWQEPAFWLPQAMLLLVVAVALSRRPAEPRWWARWDLAPLAAAHLLALLALTRSTAVGSMAITWTGFGVLSLAVAAWRRHWAWSAGGALLVLIGSSQAGPGWFALSLALAAAGSILLAQRAEGDLRSAAQWGSAVAAGWAWREMLLWTAWTPAQRIDATLLTVAAAALGLALLVRSGRAARSWLPAWAALGAGALAICAGATIGRQPPWSLTIAFLACTLALCALAPVVAPILRVLGLGFLFLAGEAAAASVGLPRLPHLSSSVLAGLVALVVAASARRSAAVRPWLSALLTYVTLQSVMAVVLAASLWPDRAGLIGTVAILGLEAAVVGVTWRRAAVLALAPPLFCASWLLFAVEGSGGDVQWVTVPIGLAILAVVDIARWPRRAGVYEPVPQPALLLLEFGGVAFLCGAALVEAITAGALYALLAVLWGLLLALWAVLTHVRRRLLLGAAVASLGLFLLVAVPVAQLVPQITGATLWAALAGLGALSLLIATTLEQSRARIGVALRRLDELTEVWE